MLDLGSSTPACTILFCCLAAACDDHAPAWTGTPDGGVVDESRPFLPGDKPEGWLGDAGTEDGDGGEDEAPPVMPGRPESRVGGLWVSCYGQFHPSGNPDKDVTRLGLMCGPVNGMQLVGKTLGGRVGPGASAEHAFPVRAGDCYRIFAVGNGMPDLHVTLRSSNGTDLARDQSQDVWPIVDPDRPLCSFGDDTFTAVVASPAGEGLYALQIWQLLARKAR